MDFQPVLLDLLSSQVSLNTYILYFPEPRANDITKVSVGAVIAFTIFMCYGMFHTKAHKAGKKWTTVEEYRRLPLAAIGAPL
jgi:hypothetical protein